jgi:hypothetical protein
MHNSSAAASLCAQPASTSAQRQVPAAIASARGAHRAMHDVWQMHMCQACDTGIAVGWETQARLLAHATD